MRDLAVRFGGVPKSDPLVGATSGVSNDVPRLDRWLDVASVIAGHESFESYRRHSKLPRFNATLNQGGGLDDSSPQAAAKMVLCMAVQLHRRDLKVFKRCIAVSLAFDERDQLLLVYARI